MKKFGKQIIAQRLGKQVKSLLQLHRPIVIAVVGSIGKTSTKSAIAQTLQAAGKKVRWQDGNYNDLITVPLIFFGNSMPSLLNPVAWTHLLRKHQKQLKRPYPYDVVVVELGIDGPGQMEQFAKYLEVDIAVVTAISPEHMEYFSSIDQVAKEELRVAEFAKHLVINTELVDTKYLKNLEFTPYDTCTLPPSGDLAGAYSTAAARTVGGLLGIDSKRLDIAVKAIQAMPGRRFELIGLNGARIIDETYNASPTACTEALHYLYKQPEKRKIALLGNMNELGVFSPAAHQEVGETCDPTQLEVVVTLGPDANTFLADAAEKKGCMVVRTQSPVEAAQALKGYLDKSTVLLAKGSQNNVYAEETVKLLLQDAADSSKLVRQSADWMKIKKKQFGSIQ